MNERMVSRASLCLVISYGRTRCINISTLSSSLEQIDDDEGRCPGNRCPLTIEMMPRIARLSTCFVPFCCAVHATLATPPSTGVAETAWETVREAIDLQKTDEIDADFAKNECWATAVVLRRAGVVVGVGRSMGPNSILRAVQDALSDFNQRQSSAGRNDRPADWSQVTLEVELASEPEPVAAASYALAGAQVAPALEGMAVRRGSDWVVAYPSILQALDAAGSPAQTYLSLVMQAGLPARELADIEPTERLALYKFETVRVVQPCAGGSPTIVVRGCRVQPLPSSTDAAALAFQTASAIVDWLARSMIQSPSGQTGQGDVLSAQQAQALSALGLRGDYQPSSGESTQLCADPAPQALAAYALAHWAKLFPDAKNAVIARETSMKILEALGRHDPVEEDPLADPKAVAWSVLAATELLSMGPLSPEAMSHLENAKGSLATIEDLHPTSGQSRLGLLDRALTLAAHCALDSATSRSARRDDLVKLADAIWTTDQRAQLVGAIDWLILCDTLLGTSSPEHAKVARATRAALARAQLARHEGEGADAMAQPPADVLGGFSLAGSGVVGANGQSARPGHALALMLADPAWTPIEECIASRAMQVALIRFLRQLAYDEVSSYLACDPRRSMGALRKSPWENTVSVAGNAMALLCLTQSSWALDRISCDLESVQK